MAHTNNSTLAEILGYEYVEQVQEFIRAEVYKHFPFLSGLFVPTILTRQYLFDVLEDHFAKEDSNEKN